MSLEQNIRELVAAARNTQSRHEITLTRGLKVVTRVNPETHLLEILIYREKPPRFDERFNARIPASSRTEAETVVRAAGGTWNSPMCLEWVKWMPWQSVEISKVDNITNTLWFGVKTRVANEKLQLERIQDRVEVCIQLMLEAYQTPSSSVEIYSALWREGLEQFPALIESKIVEVKEILKRKKIEQKRVERKANETIVTAQS